jgi:hypothetical protein
MDIPPGTSIQPDPLRRVECYSGYEYAQRPTVFDWEGCRLEVATVRASYRIPNGWQFRVEAVNQQVFELAYNEATDKWQIRPT